MGQALPQGTRTTRRLPSLWPTSSCPAWVQPTLSLDDVQLQPPKVRSGPARITGRHQMVTISNDIVEEEERGEEGCEEEGAELCPILPAKKQQGRPQHSLVREREGRPTGSGRLEEQVLTPHLLSCLPHMPGTTLLYNYQEF